MFVLTHVNSYLDQDHHRFLESNNVWSKQLTTPNMRDWWLDEQRQIIHGNVILFQIYLTYFLPSLEQANAPSKLYQSRLWILVKDGHCNKEKVVRKKTAVVQSWSPCRCRLPGNCLWTEDGEETGRMGTGRWGGEARLLRGYGEPGPGREPGRWYGSAVQRRRNTLGACLCLGGEEGISRTMENQGNAPQQIAILDKINGLNIKNITQFEEMFN